MISIDEAVATVRGLQLDAEHLIHGEDHSPDWRAGFNAGVASMRMEAAHALRALSTKNSVPIEE